MVATQKPFLYICLNGVREWNDYREAQIASQLATLESLVPVELVKNGVSRFVLDTLKFLVSPHDDLTDRDTTPTNGIRGPVSPHQAARARVIKCAVANRINFRSATLSMETNVSGDQELWGKFVKLETKQAIQQIVRLWIDFLSLARSLVQPLDDVMLGSAILLPTHNIEHHLDAVPAGDWIDQFQEMLGWNCCLLPRDLMGVLIRFFDCVHARFEATKWWSMNIVSETGNILRLEKTLDGQIVLPYGHPNDMAEHTIVPRPASWPQKQLPHNWILRQLARLACESKLTASNESVELALIRDRAERLLSQLRETAVPKSVGPMLVSVFVRGGKILFPAFSPAWIDSQLDLIFPETLDPSS